MVFGVLSAIALGIGITGAAQDLMDDDVVARQDEPQIQILEVRQPAEPNYSVWEH